MSKQVEKIKKQLLDVSDVVNSFRSEAVQVKIIERLLDAIIESEKSGFDSTDITSTGERKSKLSNTHNSGSSPFRKKVGATKVLNQILATDFFDNIHSISDIAEYCKKQYDADFKTSELSGILLKLAKENKLKRERNNENNRFEYIKA